MRHLLRLHTRVISLLVVLLLILNGSVFVVASRNLESEQSAENRSQMVLATINGLRSATLDAETGQRGFILTGQAAYLAPYTHAVTEVSPLLQRLGVQVAGNAQFQPLMPALRTAISAKLAELAKVISLRRTQGSSTAVQALLSGPGRIEMDQIRSSLDALYGVASAELMGRSASADRAARGMALALVATTAIEVVLLGGLMVLLQRAATRNSLLAGERRALLERESHARQQVESLSLWLALERDKLRRVLDLLPAAVLLTDATGRYVMCNGRARGLMGADVSGMPVQLEDPQDPTQAPDLLAWGPDGRRVPVPKLPLQRALREGVEVQDLQLYVQHATTGQRVAVLANAVPLLDSGGATVGAVATWQDISTIKDLEEQRANFMAAVSHDLKNPLTAILGMAEVLQMRVPRLDATEGMRFYEGLEVVLSSARRMSDQISELLDVALLRSASPLELALSPTDLVQLVEHLLDERRELFKRHTFTLDACTPTLVCMVDSARLQRALANLLVNAVKFSPHGGEVRVTLVREGSAECTRVRIVVQDQGIGIPAADLPHVFERLFRAANAAGRISGTGLGLAGVRQIVELHGGEVRLESAEGVGTVVKVELPFVPAPTGALVLAGPR